MQLDPRATLPPVKPWAAYLVGSLAFVGALAVIYAAFRLVDVYLFRL
mgnify:CR=1 FL=1